MRYREIINELFDGPCPYSMKVNGGNITAEFDSAGYVYEVSCAVGEFLRTYNMTFAAVTRDDDNAKNMRFGIINSGNSNQVFATMTAIFIQIMREHSPVSIAFTATELSRLKLYKRMIQRAVLNFPRYEGCQFRSDKDQLSIRLKEEFLPDTEYLDYWTYDDRNLVFAKV